MRNQTSSNISMQQRGKDARVASRVIARASSKQKNAVLLRLAELIVSNQQTLLDANAIDMKNGRSSGLDAALLDRLELTPERIAGMADGVKQVADLPDPVGEVTDVRPRPSGIEVGKMRVPLGVVGIIYESRPNVTADAAALCLKSGNASILRGGSEALASNQAIAKLIVQALTDCNMPETAVQVVDTADRAEVAEMLSLPDCVDVIIPRGGKGLVAFVAEHAKVPVIKHLDGNCHVYIDAAADLQKALAVADNSKTQRLGTCNTMETLLVDIALASTFLPEIAKIYRDKNVEMRGCTRTCSLIPDAKRATDEDWETEYLAAIVAIRVVDGFDAACDHIAKYSSGHTESIVTENYTRAQRFLREVDSSSVMINTSTRFADGFEYGLGAEIGISTDKFHARGPVGLEGLTSQKWIVRGDGHIRG